MLYTAVARKARYVISAKFFPTQENVQIKLTHECCFSLVNQGRGEGGGGEQLGTYLENTTVERRTMTHKASRGFSICLSETHLLLPCWSGASADMPSGDVKSVRSEASYMMLSD